MTAADFVLRELGMVQHCLTMINFWMGIFWPFRNLRHIDNKPNDIRLSPTPACSIGTYFWVSHCLCHIYIFTAVCLGLSELSRLRDHGPLTSRWLMDGAEPLAYFWTKQTRYVCDQNVKATVRPVAMHKKWGIIDRSAAIIFTTLGTWVNHPTKTGSNS